MATSAVSRAQQLQPMEVSRHPIRTRSHHRVI